MKSAVVISFHDFQYLTRVSPEVTVIFAGRWNMPRLRAMPIDGPGHGFIVVTDGNDAMADYVIDSLKLSQLPLIATFKYAQLISCRTYDQVITVIEDCFKPRDGILHDQAMTALTSSESDWNERPAKLLFLAGDRSSVGKSTSCLAILSALITRGVNPNHLAYIKPVTQCEAAQPVSQFCDRMGIAHRSIGPVVFYRGFTRAYLAGETEPAQVLLQQAVDAVAAIGYGKRLVLVDGVGYPSVGSICNISNADVAGALGCPVLLVGKEGVGDAVDSFNLNAAFFESRGVRVLGGMFNKLPPAGFYSLDACREAVTSYFRQFRPHQMPYGFVPKIDLAAGGHAGAGDEAAVSTAEALGAAFLRHVDLDRLLHDLLLAPIVAAVGAARDAAPSSAIRTAPQQPLRQAPPPPSPWPRADVHPVGSRKRSREEVEQAAAARGARGG